MLITKTGVSRYIKSHSFKKAWMMATLMLITGIIFHQMGEGAAIVGVSVGILLTAFTDEQGSVRLRNITMFLGLFANLTILGIANLIYPNTVLSVLYIGVVSLSCGYLILYGLRVGMMTFSALLALVLSMMKHYKGQELVSYLGTVALGGILYIIASNLYHLFTKKQQSRQQLGELASLTGKYLQLRAKEAQGDTTLKSQILALEISITELQESLRSLLLTQRIHEGMSYTKEQHVLALIELVDIYETAVTHPIVFEKMRTDVQEADAYIKTFSEVLDAFGRRLKQVSKKILDGTTIQIEKPLRVYVSEAEELIEQYVNTVGLPEARQGALSMTDLVTYFKKQATNIITMVRLVQDKDVETSLSNIGLDAKAFSSSQDYSLKRLKDNFSLKSPILKHAIRLSITMMVAYGLGFVFLYDNSYWIMLTVFLIMKPNFGMTLGRSRQRMLGTAIGVIISILILLLGVNMYVNLAIIYISMVVAVSLINKSFFGVAVAVTINVILIFSLLQPNTWAVVEARSVYTLIGGALSLLGGYLLFPVWEYETMSGAIQKALSANISYLRATQVLMNKGNLQDYKLKRKSAFLASSQLYGAFQRLTNEPKTKQKNVDDYYNFVVVHQKILSVIAEIGAFIRREDFNPLLPKVYKTIIQDLALQLETLAEKKIPTPSSRHQEAMNVILEKWQESVAQRDTQLADGYQVIDKDLKNALQQYKFFYDQSEFLQELIETASKHLV